ncbi:UxaA family hydrolase [Falsiroseomonas sp. HW251]|uniref:UxaA family hydrolase n=1 Tax=Falsiroseomonas sp. HW251 TaxID=3390998 RepID=UPI003D31CFCA
MAARWDLLVLHRDDDVAVALRDLEPGEAVARCGEALSAIRLRGAVPLGHKVARRGLARGEHVRKYGSVIGAATADIAAGDHLHVHNMRSLRARRREGE